MRKLGGLQELIEVFKRCLPFLLAGRKQTILPRYEYFPFCHEPDLQLLWARGETSTRRTRLELKPGLNSPEQPEAHLVVIARERDHKTHLPVA